MRPFVFISLLLYTFSSVGHSAIRKWRGDLQRQKKQVMELRKKLETIETSLASQNDIYLGQTQQAEKLQQGLTTVDKQLKLVGQGMLGEEEKISTILKDYMVRTLDEEEDPSSDNLYLDRMMIQGFLSKRNRYKKLKQDYFSLKSEAALLGKRIEGLKKDEETLLAFISDLENDKKRITEKFLDHRDAIRQLEEKIELSNKRTRNQALSRKRNGFGKAGLKMKSPLGAYSVPKKDKDRKGVLYLFREEKPFYAPRGGSVQYRGRLANYGDLIIIDHGDHIRSVLLGDIHPKVQKGQNVVTNEVIGYTKVGKKKEGQLYFEVRVKNKAHHTLSWIDRNSLRSKKI